MKTGTLERYVREWLSSQAASGFVDYDAETGRFTLSPEQAAVFADDDSPFLSTGGFHSLAAVYADEPKLEEAFRNGTGVAWAGHCNCLFCGVERFFRPGYRAHLLAEWLPALDGVVEKLERGAKVADVGCGHGSSTIIMAEAFPNSEFIGIDFHAESIEHAREHANGLPNVRFETARAQDYRRHGLRSRHHVRCPPRHGRPGRRDTPCSQHAQAERHPDAGRADGRRQPVRQPQPDRPGLVRLLDGGLRAGVARPGGRHSAWRPGRREAHRRGGAARRLQQLPQGAGTPFNMVLEARP